MQIVQITARKEVRISENAEGQVNAMLVQNYNGESDVLEAKSFASIKNALRWADKLALQA